MAKLQLCETAGGLQVDLSRAAADLQAATRRGQWDPLRLQRVQVPELLQRGGGTQGSGPTGAPLASAKAYQDVGAFEGGMGGEVPERVPKGRDVAGNL